MLRKAAFLIAGATMLVAAPALAQEGPVAAPGGPVAPPADGPIDDPNSLTVGLGVGYAPSYEGSDDYVATPIGIAFGKVGGFSFFTRGTALYFDVIREPAGAAIDVGFGPVANLRFDRSTQIKDDRVKALGELDMAVELGAFASIGRTGVLHQYDSIVARIHYVRDVSDTHDSYAIMPAIEYGTPLSTTTYVGASVSGEYVGGKFARTYYGVDPAGSLRSGLRTYTPDDGFKNVRFSLFASQSLTGDLRTGGLSLFAGGSYSRLLGDIADSPLVRDVGDRDQYFVSAGLSYSF